MNVKNPTGVGYVFVALVVGIAPPLFIRWVDGVDKTTLQVSMAHLETQVSDLSEQVKKLTDQPYVRRDEYEGRLAGFDGRIRELERQQQSGR